MFLDQTVPHMLFRSQGREVLTLAESFYFSPTEGLHQNMHRIEAEQIQNRDLREKRVNCKPSKALGLRK